MITSNPTIDLSDRNATIIYVDDGVAVFRVLASPEGLVAANKGSIAIDTAGNWYRKTTNLLATGWVGVNAGDTSPVGVLHRDLTAVGNQGAGEDDLHTYTIAAGTLGTDGDYLRVIQAGNYAATVNTKQVRMYFGGIVFFDTGPVVLNNRTWVATFYAIRTASDAIRICGSFETENETFTNHINTGFIVPDMELNATVLRVTGESGAATSNDVLQNVTLIEQCTQQ